MPNDNPSATFIAVATLKMASSLLLGVLGWYYSWQAFQSWDWPVAWLCALIALGLVLPGLYTSYVGAVQLAGHSIWVFLGALAVPVLLLACMGAMLASDD